MIRVEWPTALVTGASRGIGRGIVLKLAECGVRRIAVNYLENAAAAGDTARELRARGAEAVLLQGDVGDPGQLARLFAEVERLWGELGIFVHNARPAASVFYQPPQEVTAAALRAAFDTQALAMTLGCQASAKLMPKGGRIVGITYAQGGRTGSWQPWIAMGGAKAFLESTVRYFAVALARQGITVNCVSPGPTDDSVLSGLPAPVFQAIKEWSESGWTPMRRMGTPADMGNAVALLCTAEAGWITGQTLHADGGASVMNSELPLPIQGLGPSGG
jgi:NAD(P)-dependent dehydrogenase (short-subunit alcohol dehydrogenase family)